MSPVSANIDQARALLVVNAAAQARPLAALGAAFLAASAAILMASVMVLGPGIALKDEPAPAWAVAPG